MIVLLYIRTVVACILIWVAGFWLVICWCFVGYDSEGRPFLAIGCKEMLTSSVMRMSAADVLKEYWNGDLPVRPDLIAKRQGITVFEAPMSLSFSGQIQSAMDGGFQIIVNARESSTRNRFTIAHELGHFNLGHMDDGHAMCRDGPEQYSTANPDIRERQANDFAACLLMPEDAVRYVLGRGHATSVQEMKAMFGVSEAAMRFRLKNLGLL